MRGARGEGVDRAPWWTEPFRLVCQGVWERCESVCTAGSSAVPRLRSVCMAVPRGGPHIGGDDGIPGARGALTSWEGCERVWFE
jgi:hypothetical protein